MPAKCSMVKHVEKEINVLRAEKELAGLAEKLIIYRFRVALANMTLTFAVIGAILAFALTLLFTVGPPRLPWIPAGLSGAVGLTAIIATFFAAAAVLHPVYEKSLRGLSRLIPGEEESLVKRLNAAPIVSYTVPFAIFYLVKPYPGWESHAWYFALTLASLTMYAMYERALNSRVKGLRLRIYLVLTALMAVLSPLVVAAASAWGVGGAVAVAVMAFLASSLIASLQEIYRAEREL